MARPQGDHDVIERSPMQPAAAAARQTYPQHFVPGRKGSAAYKYGVSGFITRLGVFESYLLCVCVCGSFQSFF